MPGSTTTKKTTHAPLAAAPVTSAAGSKGISRRSLLSAGVRGAGMAGMAALAGGVPMLSGCKKRVQAAATGDGPEVPSLRLGIIALTDCSPVVIAHEKGFFRKYGINA